VSASRDVHEHKSPTLTGSVRRSAGGRGFVIPAVSTSRSQWLLVTGRLTGVVRGQSETALGRRSRVPVSFDGDGQIWVVGDMVTCIHGIVEL